MPPSDSSDEWVDSSRILAAALLLDEDDEVRMALSNREWSKPFRVVGIDVTDWGEYRTAELTLEQTDVSFAERTEHTILGVEGSEARWQRGEHDRPLHEFDPVDYAEADLAAADFADGLSQGTRDPDDAMTPAENSAERSDATALRAPEDVNTMAARVPCYGCGGSVTKDYARVFSPRESPQYVEACPDCPDKVRGADGRARENRHLAAGGGD